MYNLCRSHRKQFQIELHIKNASLTQWESISKCSSAASLHCTSTKLLFFCTISFFFCRLEPRNAYSDLLLFGFIFPSKKSCLLMQHELPGTVQCTFFEALLVCPSVLGTMVYIAVRCRNNLTHISCCDIYYTKLWKSLQAFINV